MLNSFKMALHGTKKPLGTLVMSGSPLISELLACAGFDFLVIDTEHGLSSLPTLLAQAQAVASAGHCQSIVRVPGHAPDHLKQILDVTGITNLMFPMVDTKEQAEELVAVTTYPPDGYRGFARFSRATRYNTIADYIPTASSRLCRIAQVETETAFKNLQAIGKTKGIDSVFLGLGDYALLCGVPAGVGDPEFRKFVESRLQECNNAGIKVGGFMLSTSQASWFLQAGADYVSIGIDLKSLMDVAKKDLEVVRPIS